jgi:hypothetical protein
LGVAVKLQNTNTLETSTRTTLKLLFNKPLPAEMDWEIGLELDATNHEFPNVPRTEDKLRATNAGFEPAICPSHGSKAFYQLGHADRCQKH